MQQKVDILFGGQFGSEGKGVIAARLAFDYDIHVRVGAPNAGHSFIGPDKRLWKMQTIPCGWINPQARLIIGRGGLIDPVLLRQEVVRISEIDPTIYERLHIDSLCGVLDSKFHKMEGGVDGEMHKRIGSTGEGVGPAREARISRDPNRFRLYRDLAKDDPWFAQFELPSTPDVLYYTRKKGARILLEGAQGQGLSLIHGPWPYATSTDPGPAQLAADVGISIRDIGRIIACFRTHPIRVAGNSGPLAQETSWDILSMRLGKVVKEQTTVTKKTRRIALWDDDIAASCRILHRPTEVALMFMDYHNPIDEGIETYNDLSVEAKNFIKHVESVVECPVTFIGTGGPILKVIRR